MRNRASSRLDTKSSIRARRQRILAFAVLFALANRFQFLFNLEHVLQQSYYYESAIIKYKETSLPTRQISCSKNEKLPINWCLDVNRVPRYLGIQSETAQHNNNNNTLKVEHYTHDGFEQCLADKTVVFIGDSRVRYQLLDLAAYLKNHRFLKCFDHSYYHDAGQLFSPDKECSLIFKNSVTSMTEWFSQSTNMLTSQNSSVQRVLCDCYRPPANDAFDRTMDNRFIKRMTSSGEINLIYFRTMVNRIRISGNFPPFSSFGSSLNNAPSAQHCEPGECAFEGDLNATLWNVLPLLNTTHAFINLGWEHLFGLEAQSELSCLMEQYTKQYPHIKLYLISHPPARKDVINRIQLFDAKYLKCEVPVLDLSTTNADVPLEWYFDNMHVMSILNEEYNHQLVETICPISSSSMV